MKINGIQFPVVGVSWEIEPEEKVYAVKLIDFLEGKRILFNDCMNGCKNCKERSVKSVLEAKKFTTDMLFQLSKETDFKMVLRVIRQNSNIFLNDMDFEENYRHIINTNNKTFCPILTYRKDMAESVLKIMEMFDIRDIGNLFYLLNDYIN